MRKLTPASAVLPLAPSITGQIVASLVSWCIFTVAAVWIGCITGDSPFFLFIRWNWFELGRWISCTFSSWGGGGRRHFGIFPTLRLNWLPVVILGGIFFDEIKHYKTRFEWNLFNCGWRSFFPFKIPDYSGVEHDGISRCRFIVERGPDRNDWSYFILSTQQG